MRIFDGQPEALAGDSVFVAPLEAALRRRTELRLGTTWSWAELAPDQEDFEWLLGWAERAGGISLQQWLERPPDIRIAAQRVEVCGQRYDRRDVAGALLSFVLAEVGRRAATEDEFWSPVRDSLPTCMGTALFPDGQPSAPLCSALKRARRTGLRNSFNLDGPGDHSWVVSLRMQFGTTADGLRNRLTSWLQGASPPRAVSLLLSPAHGSARFSDLWSALHDIRTGIGADDGAWRVVDESPWLLDEWREELPGILCVARPSRYRETAPTARRATPEAEPEPALPRAPEQIIQSALLRWPWPASPYWELKSCDLRGLRLPGDPGRCEVTLAGKCIGAMVRSAEGGFRAEWGSTLDQWPVEHAVAGDLVLTIADPRSDQGEPLWTEFVPLWNAEEPFALYDLSTGRLVEDVDAPLPPDRDYAFVLSPEATISGADGGLRLGDTDRYLVRVPAGQLPRVQVSWSAGEWWRATTAPLPEWLDDVELSMADQAPARIGQWIDAVVTHPEDVLVRAATWRGRPLAVQPEHDWQTMLRGVPVPPGLWGGDLTIRLELERPNQSETVSRRLQLDRVGLSTHLDDRWQCTQVDMLDLGQVGSSLVIIHAPEPSPLGRDWSVYEGTNLRPLPLGRPTRLTHLARLGEALTLRGVRYDGQPTEPVELVASVVDSGYLASVEEVGCDGLRLVLRRQLPRTHDHRVLWWGRDGQLDEVSAEAAPDRMSWVIESHADAHPPRALAIEIKETRLGSYWADDWADDLPLSLCPVQLLRDIERLGLPALAPEPLASVCAWLLTDPNRLWALCEAGVTRLAEQVAAAALGLWQPEPKLCRNWLLDHLERDRLVRLARIAPDRLALAVEAAVEGKQPLPSSYEQALCKLAWELAGQHGEAPRTKDGIKGLALSCPESVALRRFAACIDNLRWGQKRGV